MHHVSIGMFFLFPYYFHSLTTCFTDSTQANYGRSTSNCDTTWLQPHWPFERGNNRQWRARDKIWLLTEVENKVVVNVPSLDKRRRTLYIPHNCQKTLVNSRYSHYIDSCSQCYRFYYSVILPYVSFLDFWAFCLTNFWSFCLTTK